MKLSNPMLITSRLLPGFRIGDTLISIDYQGVGRDGRLRYRVIFDMGAEDKKLTKKKSITVNGFGSPNRQDRDSLIIEQARAILSFLGAFAEASRYGPDSDNWDLFPDSLRAWALNYSSEIELLGFELTENQDFT